VGGRIFILLLYVDDILAIVDKEDAERITAHLVAKFGTVVFERNGELSYLGMEIEISDEGTKIDMSFYVRQIIGDAEERSVLTEYESPGTKETFVAQEGAGILCKKSRIYSTLLWQNCSTWQSVRGQIY